MTHSYIFKGLPFLPIQALTLLHRWVVRTFMAIRTPARQERTSTVMVPGVRRDPAVLYRSQYILKSRNPSILKFFTPEILKVFNLQGPDPHPRLCRSTHFYQVP